MPLRYWVDGKQDFQQRAVADYGGVETDLYGFGMAGIALADGGVARRFGVAVDVARNGLFYALDAVVNGFDTPEAAAGKNCGFHSVSSAVLKKLL